LNKAKNISNLVLNRNKKNIAEIGFNSGFSALLMLISNPELHVTCYDIGCHKYTMPCFLKLTETFGNRVKLIIGDSVKTLKKVNDRYQIIHIDGGHSTEIATSDILNSYRLSSNGTVLIMDDYDFPNLHELWDHYINSLCLRPIDIHLYETNQHDVKIV
jgi:predicted O-methyltransferase YrrM